MFARFVTLLPLAALAVVAAAAPNAPDARTTPTCNTGAVYCCNQESIRSQNTSLFTGPYGLVFNAGVQCTAIYVVGVLSSGAQCTQQTPCCNNVNQVSLGPWGSSSSISNSY
ncbi:hydrophobin [Boletus edulis]|nr:hydrophobin [Boletus edulis]